VDAPAFGHAFLGPDLGAESAGRKYIRNMEDMPAVYEKQMRNRRE
jgi:hypothetical protein